MFEFSGQAVKVFKALSDPTRYEIIRMLCSCQELGCCELEKAFPLSKPALSHHYRVLENVGLISSRKEGARIYYRLERERLERFLPGFEGAHLP